MKIFQELRRRNVFKVAIAYGVTTWILLQMTDVVSEILELPEWAPKLVLLLLVVGFVPAVIMAWAFELTPEGLKLEKDVVRERSVTRRTGRKLDYTIIALLGLSLGYFVWESRFNQKTAEFEEAKTTAEVQAEMDARAKAAAAMEIPADLNRNSIAVLPFANRSADATDQYFTDGIHDDLLTQLSKIDAFSVISRTSVMEYRDTTKNLREIARELSVANIMEGAVQRAGDRVRINVQLIDAYTDEHLWAEIYDRELTTNNLFDIQSEIAQAIATALKATLTDAEIASVGSVPTQNVAAYDLYLQARQFEIGQNKIGYQTALELFKAAIEADPEFALAWIGLARAHISNYWLYGGNPADRDATRKAIDRAREINPNFSELYMAEGFYWYWGFLDYERALYNLDRAIELMPGNYEAYMWRGWASRRSGLWEQTLESMQQALLLNPREYFNWVEFGFTHIYLHQYDQAGEAFRKAGEISPNQPWVKEAQARLALQAFGDAQKAIILTTGAQHSGESTFVEGFINARLYGGRLEEALETARKIPDDMEVQRQYITLKEDWAAQILHYLGRTDEARDAANAALFRLKTLRARLGNDYRFDLPETRLAAILGESPEAVRAGINKALASQPADEVEDFRVKLESARVFGMAGMAADAVGLLGGLIEGPSETSVLMINLDPAFNSIRNEPEFVALMEREP